MTLAIFKKQFSDLWREKTFVLILLLIFFIIISLSVLIAVTAFVYNPEFLLEDNVNIGYVGTAPLEEHSGRVDWYRYTNTELMITDYENGTIDAMVTQIDENPHMFNVKLPPSPVKNSLISALLKDTFQKYQNQLLTEQDQIDVITPANFLNTGRQIRGIDTIFEILFGFALPLFLIIPIFLIGNLFIDNISEDFERKNNNLLFTVTSPLQYIHETLLVGLLTNTALVLILQVMIYLRFDFLVQPVLVFFLITLFFGVVAQFAVYMAFVFKMKTPAQLAYSFGVLSFFLLATYLPMLPIKTISATMLGIQVLNPFYLVWVIPANLILYAMIRHKVKQEYYA